MYPLEGFYEKANNTVINRNMVNPDFNGMNKNNFKESIQSMDIDSMPEHD